MRSSLISRTRTLPGLGPARLLHALAAEPAVAEPEAARSTILVDARLDAAPQTSKTSKINANFERLRVLAALAVIYVHAISGDWFLRDLCKGSLSVFVLVAMILAVHHPAPPGLGLVRKRAARLLVPFAAWVGVYLAVDLARAVVDGVSPVAILRRFNPLYGTRIHLWYLPFAFVMLLFAAWFVRRTGGRAGRRLLTWLGAAAIVVAFAPLVFLVVGDPPEPVPQYLLGAPGIFFGLFFGLAGARSRPDATRALAVLSALTVLLFVPAYALIDHDSIGSTFIAYAFAVPLVAAAVLWPGGRLDPLTKLLAPLTYGIYLAHPFVILVLYRIPGFDVNDPLLGVAGVFVASALVTFALQRSRLRFAV